MTNSTSERALEIERHADGSAFVVDPDPILRDSVNGQFAVVMKCASVEEARDLIQSLTLEQEQHPKGSRP